MDTRGGILDDEDYYSRFSDSHQRLYRIREVLQGEADESRAMTPEQSAALSALNSMGATKKLYRRARRLFGMKGDDLDRLVADAYPPAYDRISMSDAAGMRECPFPGVIVIANNKGAAGSAWTPKPR